MMSIKSSQLELTGHSTCLSLTCCHLLFTRNGTLLSKLERESKARSAQKRFFKFQLHFHEGFDAIIPSKFLPQESRPLFFNYISIFTFSKQHNGCHQSSSLSHIIDDEGSLTLRLKPNSKIQSRIYFAPIKDKNLLATTAACLLFRFFFENFLFKTFQRDIWPMCTCIDYIVSAADEFSSKGTSLNHNYKLHKCFSQLSYSITYRWCDIFLKILICIYKYALTRQIECNKGRFKRFKVRKNASYNSQVDLEQAHLKLKLV